MLVLSASAVFSLLTASANQITLEHEVKELEQQLERQMRGEKLIPLSPEENARLKEEQRRRELRMLRPVICEAFRDDGRWVSAPCW